MKIAKNVITGVGSVFKKDIPNNSIAIGNPSKIIEVTSKWVDKKAELLSSSEIYV